MTTPPHFILASKSTIRAKILHDAGLVIETQASTVDERAVEAPAMQQGVGPAGIAELLARAKALDVSQRRPGCVVIGADQTLALGDQRFSKPGDRAAAAAQLRALRDASHALHSAAAIARDGKILWSGGDAVHLTMRSFSEAFLENYLDVMGNTVTTTVGGYQLEGIGIQLFSGIKGDYFTVLGLPLLPLLAALRDLKLLPA